MKKILSVLFVIGIFYFMVPINVTKTVQATIKENSVVSNDEITISNENKEDSLKISGNIKTQEYYDTKYKRDMFIYKIILSFLVVLTSVALTYIQSMRRYKIVTRTYYD